MKFVFGVIQLQKENNCSKNQMIKNISENSLLIGLRISHKFSPSDVVAKAGMAEEYYLKLESGQLKMKVDDAGQLSVTYKIEPEVFLQSQSHITGNNIGEFSKRVVYAAN